MMHVCVGSSQAQPPISSSCSKPKLCPISCAIVAAGPAGIVWKSWVTTEHYASVSKTRTFVQRLVTNEILISKALRMARVNEESHSFTCHPHVYPRMEWAILHLILCRSTSPHFGRYLFPVPQSVAGWVYASDWSVLQYGDRLRAEMSRYIVIYVGVSARRRSPIAVLTEWPNAHFHLGPESVVSYKFKTHGQWDAKPTVTFPASPPTDRYRMILRADGKKYWRSVSTASQWAVNTHSVYRV